MKDILFFVLTLSLIILSCSSVKRTNLSAIKQGITGRITEAAGNQMPMRGTEPQTPAGIRTTVFFYEPTNISQVGRIGESALYTVIRTKLVASAETDSTGRFSIELPVGSYSLFIKQGDQFYANLFDTNNNIALFRVEEGKVTEANLTVSLRASY